MAEGTRPSPNADDQDFKTERVLVDRKTKKRTSLGMAAEYWSKVHISSDGTQLAYAAEGERQPTLSLHDVKSGKIVALGPHEAASAK